MCKAYSAFRQWETGISECSWEKYCSIRSIVARTQSEDPQFELNHSLGYAHAYVRRREVGTRISWLLSSNWVKLRFDSTKNHQANLWSRQKIMQDKEPVVGFEPTACSLRSSYSTTELHRLMDYLKHVINTLVEHLTLAIIPFAYSPCQAFFHPGSRSFWVTHDAKL